MSWLSRNISPRVYQTRMNLCLSGSAATQEKYETSRFYEQIGEMTVFDVAILFQYWREQPTAADILNDVYKGETNPEPEKNIEIPRPARF
ncbi:MAG: hypothetical protein ACT4O2_02925 [Beijerinckiaceae bacterium]